MVYHWERENTGIEKFSRDHIECMQQAKDFRFLPNIKQWFISEETKLDIRADWNASKGVWASYIAYPGAQPMIMNFSKNDSDVSPRKYRICMEKKGYWHRTSEIPSVTNINEYNPRGYGYYVPFKTQYQ